MNHLPCLWHFLGLAMQGNSALVTKRMMQKVNDTKSTRTLLILHAESKICKLVLMSLAFEVLLHIVVFLGLYLAKAAISFRANWASNKHYKDRVG